MVSAEGCKRKWHQAHRTHKSTLAYNDFLPHHSVTFLLCHSPPSPSNPLSDLCSYLSRATDGTETGGLGPVTW